jgi:hypothetical protein
VLRRAPSQCALSLELADPTYARRLPSSTSTHANLKSSFGNRLSLSRHPIYPKQNHPKLDTNYIAGRVPHPHGFVQTVLSKMTRGRTYARASTLSRRVIPIRFERYRRSNQVRWPKIQRRSSVSVTSSLGVSCSLCKTGAVAVGTGKHTGEADPGGHPQGHLSCLHDLLRSHWSEGACTAGFFAAG